MSRQAKECYRRDVVASTVRLEVPRRIRMEEKHEATVSPSVSNLIDPFPRLDVGNSAQTDPKWRPSGVAAEVTY